MSNDAIRRASGIIGYVREYNVWQHIEEYSQRRRAYAQANNDPSVKELKVSDGRAVRRRIDEVLRQRLGDNVNLRNVEMSDEKLNEFIQGVMSDMYGDYEKVPYDPSMSVVHMRSSNKRDTYTYFNYALSGSRFGDNGSLPISPYDPRYTWYTSMMNHGSALGFLSVDEIYEYWDASPAGRGSLEHIHDSMHRNAVIHFEEQVPHTENETRLGLEVPLRTVDDAVGLSRLRPYMSLQEYNAIGPRVRRAAMRNGVITSDVFMHDDAFDRSIAILEYLKSNGIDYTLEPDLNDGQIRARLTGTQINVRVFELNTTDPNSDRYVGRVYNGRSIYYSIDAGSRSGGNGRDKSRYVIHNATPKEAVDLLRLVRGETVYRDDANFVSPDNDKYHLAVGEVYPRDPRPGQKQDSYLSTSGNYTFYYGTVKDSQSEYYGRPVNIHMRKEKSSSEFFDEFTPDSPYGVEKANRFIREAVESARTNYAAELDVEMLIEQAEQAAEAENEARQRDPNFDVEMYRSSESMPDFSSFSDIETLQHDYWRVLRGEKVTLIRPDVSREEFNKTTRELEKLNNDRRLGRVDETEYAHRYGYLNGLIGEMSGRYLGGSAADAVRRHAADVISMTVAENMPDNQLVTGGFNMPVVATHMASSYANWKNYANLAQASRILNIGPDALLGSDEDKAFAARQLARYNPDTSQPINEHPDEFIREAGTRVREALERRGARVDEIRIDDQGIIYWRAERRVGQNNESKKSTDRQRVVQGFVGQVFSPEPTGEIVTKFGGGEENNFVIVPGYEASIVGEEPGEDKNVFERLRLTGYKQKMLDAIGYRVSDDITLTTRSAVGYPTSLNGVYSGLYDRRFDVHFRERMVEEGMTPHEIDNLIEAESHAVYFGKEIKDGATTQAIEQAERIGKDHRNDNNRDPLNLVGYKNMSVVSDGSNNIFSRSMTGTAANHGIVRYLNKDSVVHEDGTVTPSPTGEEIGLVSDPEYRFAEFDPHDRQNMTHSTVRHALHTAKNVNVAMLNYHGWNYEDGMVISKEFAEAHPVRGVDGEMRPLQPGDKLSDLHGNKGVINAIADRDMSLEEAEKRGVTELVELYRANPHLDVLMSPFSFVSRHNAGSARELMAGNVQPVVVPQDGEAPKVIEGGMSTTSLVVTSMTTDTKSHIYDDEDIRAGSGRKTSGQLMWVLQAKGAEKVAHSFFGANVANYMKAVEFYNVLGVKLDGCGGLSLGIDEDRPLIGGESVLEYNKNGGIHKKNTLDKFTKEISEHGGNLIVPFPIKLASGEFAPRIDDDSEGHPQYAIPLISKHLRSEVELNEGSVSQHDHTLRYMQIFEQSLDFIEARNKKDFAKQDAAKNKAQAQYDVMATNVISRYVESKSNIMKTGIMTARQPNSSTMVWRAHPHLALDEVAMSKDVAQQLDPKGKGYVMVWRDPILRDGGVRYMRVVIDDHAGPNIAVNPLAVKSFDGDFDGDTVGVVGNLKEDAHREAIEMFSMEANMLDHDAGKPRQARDEQGNRLFDKNGDPVPATQAEIDKYGPMEYPLAVHTGLDVAISMYHDPTLRQKMEQIVDNLHAADWAYRKHVASEKDNLFDPQGSNWKNGWRNYMRDQMADLNQVFADAMHDSAGQTTIRFDSIESHMDSVLTSFLTDVGVREYHNNVPKEDLAPYEHGAKGSFKKVEDEYATYVGVGVNKDRTYTDYGHTLATQAHHEGSERALSFKTQGTGIAGSRSQKAVMALCDSPLTMRIALALGYPSTQSMLQAKKNPVDAQYRFDTINNSLRDLWHGRYMTCTPTGPEGRYEWTTHDRRATKEEWVQQMQQMMCDDKGMGVDIGIDRIRDAAEMLSDSRGIMYDIDKTAQPIAIYDIAYHKSFDNVVKLAQQHAQLFDGNMGKYFCSDDVRQNINDKHMALSQGQPYDVPMIRFADVAPDYKRTFMSHVGRGVDNFEYSAVTVNDVISEEARRSHNVPSRSAGIVATVQENATQVRDRIVNNGHYGESFVENTPPDPYAGRSGMEYGYSEVHNSPSQEPVFGGMDDGYVNSLIDDFQQNLSQELPQDSQSGFTGHAVEYGSREYGSREYGSGGYMDGSGGAPAFGSDGFFAGDEPEYEDDVVSFGDDGMPFGAESPRHEPPRHEPPRHESSRQEPPRQEPPRQEPPRQEPPSQSFLSGDMLRNSSDEDMTFGASFGHNDRIRVDQQDRSAQLRSEQSYRRQPIIYGGGAPAVKQEVQYRSRAQYDRQTHAQNSVSGVNYGASVDASQPQVHREFVVQSQQNSHQVQNQNRPGKQGKQVFTFGQQNNTPSAPAASDLRSRSRDVSGSRRPVQYGGVSGKTSSASHPVSDPVSNNVTPNEWLRKQQDEARKLAENKDYQAPNRPSFVMNDEHIDGEPDVWENRRGYDDGPSL